MDAAQGRQQQLPQPAIAGNHHHHHHRPRMHSRSSMYSYISRPDFRFSAIPAPLTVSSEPAHDSPTGIPRVPARAFRVRSLKDHPRIPTSMPYTMRNLRAAHNKEEGYERAEHGLGLQRMSIAHPATAIDSDKPSHASTSSTSTLPSYNKPLPDLPSPTEPLNGRTAWLHALMGFLVVFNC